MAAPPSWQGRAALTWRRVAGVCATFTLSGVIHELAFFDLTRRLSGMKAWFRRAAKEARGGNGSWHASDWRHSSAHSSRHPHFGVYSLGCTSVPVLHEAALLCTSASSPSGQGSMLPGTYSDQRCTFPLLSATSISSLSAHTALYLQHLGCTYCFPLTQVIGCCSSRCKVRCCLLRTCCARGAARLAYACHAC